MSNTKKTEGLALEIRKSKLENLQKVNGSFNIYILSGADTNNERLRLLPLPNRREEEGTSHDPRGHHGGDYVHSRGGGE